MLNDDPLYQPAEDSASPRVLSVFRETRRLLLPGIVRERYAAAKAAFERRDPQARERFELVLTLLDDPEIHTLPTFADLRTVVAAFRDVCRERGLDWDALKPQLLAKSRLHIETY